MIIQNISISFLFLLISFHSYLSEKVSPNLILTYLCEPNLLVSAFSDFDWHFGENQLTTMTVFEFPSLTFIGRGYNSFFKFPAQKITYPIAYCELTFTVLGPESEWYAGGSNVPFWSFFTNFSSFGKTILSKEYTLEEFGGYLVGTLSIFISNPSKEFNLYLTTDTFAIPYEYSLGNMTLSFFNCSHHCQECSDPHSDFKCSKCWSNSELTSFGTCQCKNGFYWEDYYPCLSDIISDCFLCLPCNLPCRTCLGPSSNQCTSCILNQFFYNNNCVEYCPSNLPFMNRIDPLNHTCDGLCPPGTFALDYNCEVCSSNCEVCNNSSDNCSICFEGFYFIDFDRSCRECPYGYFKQNINTTCEACTSNCLDCNSTNCSLCHEEFIISEGHCILKYIPIGVSLKQITGRNLSFLLKFNESDNPIFEGILNDLSRFSIDFDSSLIVLHTIYQTIIENTFEIDFQIPAAYVTSNNPFSLTIDINGLNETIYYLSVAVLRDILNLPEIISIENNGTSNDSIINDNNINTNQTSNDSINNNSENSNNSIIIDNNNEIEKIKIDENTMTYNTSNFCGNDSFYNEASKSCLKKSLIDFELFFLNFQYPLFLKITSEGNPLKYASFPSLFLSIMSSSSILIAKLSSEDYKSSIFLHSSKEFLVISLNFTHSILSSNLLNFSTALILKNGSNYTLVKTFETILLPDIYVLSEETKKLINDTSKLIENSQSISSQMTLLNSFLNIVNLMSLRILTIVDLLQFFKFLNIKFPINMLKIFNSSTVSFENELNDFNIKESRDDPLPEGKFDYYSISTYFFNNSKMLLLQFLGAYFLGVLILLLARKFKFVADAIEMDWYKVKGKCGVSLFFKCLIGLIFKLIVWNFIIAQFLSSFNENILYCLVSFYWPPLHSPLGKVNFSFGSLYFIILIISSFYLFYKIRTFRNIQSYYKKNMVVPLKDEKINKNISNPQECVEEPQKNNEIIVEDLEKLPEMDKKPSNSWDLSEFYDITPHLKPPLQDMKILLNSSVNNKSSFSAVPWEKIKNLPSLNHTEKNYNLGSSSFTSPCLINEVDSQNGKIKKLSLEIPTTRLEISLEEISARTGKTGSNVINKISPYIKVSAVLSKEDEMKKYNNEEKKLKSRYNILFKGMKKENGSHYYFLLYEMARQMSISMLLVLLCDKPFVNSLIIECLNLFFFITVLIIRPYKFKKDLIISLFTDIGLNIAGGVCCKLAYMDENHDFDEEKRMTLGWIFVLTNCSLILLLIFIYTWQIIRFLWLILRFLWRFYQKKKALKKEI